MNIEKAIPEKKKPFWKFLPHVIAVVPRGSNIIIKIIPLDNLYPGILVNKEKSSESLY